MNALAGDLEFARDALSLLVSSSDAEKKKAVSAAKEAAGLQALAQEVLLSGNSDDSGARKFLMKRRDVMKTMQNAMENEQKLSSDVKKMEKNVLIIQAKMTEVTEVIQRARDIQRSNSNNEGEVAIDFLKESENRVPIPPVERVDRIEEKFRKLETEARNKQS